MLAVAALLTWIQDNDGLVALGFFLFCVGIGMGLIAVVSIFRELTNSQLCDVKMSMPMSSKERFLSRLLTLGYVQIFPMLVYGLFGALGMFIMWVLADSPSYPMYGLFTGKEIFQLYVIMVSLVVFVDVVTIFCTCCCGALAESVYFSVIALGCTSILPGVLYTRLVSGMAGSENGLPEFIKYWTLSTGLSVDSDTLWEFMLCNIVSIVLSCLLLIDAYLIFRKRDARSVGDPIAMPWFFEAILLIGVFMVYSVFICTSALLIGLIITAVIYVVINIIVIRGKITFKRIMGWVLKLAATTALFLAITVAAFLTDGFGAYTGMPIRKLDNNKLFISSYHYYDGGTAEPYSVDYDANMDYNEFTDEQYRDAIKTVRSYGIRDKSFKRFISLISDSAWVNESDDWLKDTTEVQINLTRVKHVKSKNKNGKVVVEDYDVGMIYQTIYVHDSDLEELFNELESKGISVHRNVYYPEVYDEYEEY